jgi:hypothetical protein
VPFLDGSACSTDLARGVVEQGLTLIPVHLSEEVTRLLVMIVIDPMIPMSGCPRPICSRLRQTSEDFWAGELEGSLRQRALFGILDGATRLN